MDRKIRVAVVGTGKIATRARIPAYLSNENVDLIALVDVNQKTAERTAREFKIGKISTSIDELLDEENLDAISICTPPNTHADLALKALEHGCHVLCEKPMANDVKSAKRIFEASVAKKKLLTISSQRRLHSIYRRVKKCIDSGRLGHVYCIEDIAQSPSPLLSWGKSPWYYQSEGGGVLFDMGPHCFDMLNYFFEGFPDAISARCSTYLDSPVEECSVCTLEYPQKRVGIVSMGWLSSVVLAHTIVHGTSASIYFSPKLFLEVNRTDVPEISLWREVSLSLIGPKLRYLPILGLRPAVDLLQLETNRFIEQIRQNRISFSSALNALNVLITIDAAKRSSAENRMIRISPVNAP